MLCKQFSVSVTLKFSSKVKNKISVAILYDAGVFCILNEVASLYMCVNNVALSHELSRNEFGALYLTSIDQRFTWTGANSSVLLRACFS